jgi:hypothetical protein
LVLILDDPTTWPDHIKSRLQQEPVVELLRHNEFMDELVRHPVLRPVLAEIEEYVAATPLAAYHCTKQLPERPFSVTGLRPLDFAQHHAEIRQVLRNHKSVTPALFSRIDAGLSDWQKNHTGKREKMLWSTDNIGQFHGIKYRSSRKNGGICYAIFADQAACLPTDRASKQMLSFVPGSIQLCPELKRQESKKGTRRDGDGARLMEEGL